MVELIKDDCRELDNDQRHTDICAGVCIHVYKNVSKMKGVSLNNFNEYKILKPCFRLKSEIS